MSPEDTTEEVGDVLLGQLLKEDWDAADRMCEQVEQGQKFVQELVREMQELEAKPEEGR